MIREPGRLSSARGDTRDPTCRQGDRMHGAPRHARRLPRRSPNKRRKTAMYRTGNRVRTGHEQVFQPRMGNASRGQQVTGRRSGPSDPATRSWTGRGTSAVQVMNRFSSHKHPLHWAAEQASLETAMWRSQPLSPHPEDRSAVIRHTRAHTQVGEGPPAPDPGRANTPRPRPSRRRPTSCLCCRGFNRPASRPGFNHPASACRGSHFPAVSRCDTPPALAAGLLGSTRDADRGQSDTLSASVLPLRMPCGEGS